MLRVLAPANSLRRFAPDSLQHYTLFLDLSLHIRHHWKMCNHHTSAAIPGSHLGVVWRPDDNDDVILPMPAQPGSSELYRPDILETIEAKIKEMIAESRELSDDIHGNWQTSVLSLNI